MRRKISTAIGIPYDQMIGIKREDPPGVCEPPMGFGADAEHICIVQRFRHKPEALEINRLLLELEDAGGIEHLNAIREQIVMRLTLLGRPPRASGNPGNRKTSNGEP